MKTSEILYKLADYIQGLTDKLFDIRCGYPKCGGPGCVSGWYYYMKHSDLIPWVNMEDIISNAEFNWLCLPSSYEGFEPHKDIALIRLRDLAGRYKDAGK